MKRYPAGHNDENRNTQGPYKSKFLQQYGNDQGTESDDTPSGYGANYKRQQQQMQPARNAPRQSEQAEYGNHQNNNYVQDADDGFMNSLRGAGGHGSGKKAAPPAGPGWNDDIAADGFGEPRALKPKATAAKGRPRAQPPQQSSSNYDDDGYAQQERQGVRASPQQAAPRQQASRTMPQREWNMDTEVSHGLISTLPPKISPRITPRGAAPQRSTGRVDSEVAANQARPTLSLLKSKIRRSESGKNVLAMDSTDSAASLNSNSYHGGSNATSEQVSDIRRSGRRSAPNQSYSDNNANAAGASDRAGRTAPRQAPSNSRNNDGYGQYDQDEDKGYGQAQTMGGGRNSHARQPQPQQQQRGRQPAPEPIQDDYMDNPYGPDAYPPGQYPPKVAAAGAGRNNNAASRLPPPQQQQRSQTQPSRRQPAPEPRYEEDNPYGPDAYPPGEYPPKFSSPAGAAPSEYPDDDGEQLECPDCGRKFNPIPYEKHIKICKKVFLQKRKVFDSTKMRLATGDPEMEKLAVQASKEAAKLRRKKEAMEAAAAAAASAPQQGKGPGGGFPGNGKAGAVAPQAQAPPAKKQTNQNTAVVKQAGGGGGGGGGGTKEENAAKWRDQSNAFREAMKAARQYSKAVAEGKPLPPPVISAPDKSLVPCPHCGRSFNEKAADRHIPQCQNIKAKPSALKRGAGGGGGVNGSLSATANSSGKNRGRGGF